MANVEFTRGASSGIDSQPLSDGQILFDRENKRILLDAVVNNTLTRIVMKDSEFTGTAEEWEALTDAQKAAFRIVNITNDYESHTQVFHGATATTDGTPGLVPAPLAGDQDKVLNGAGQWVDNQGGGGGSADDITYDGTTSGLSSTNVQDAIDEIVEGMYDGFDGTVQTFDSSTAPTEPSDKIYQYVGTTTGDLINGYFYRVEEVTPATTPPTYHYVNVPTGSSVNVVDNLNSTSSTDALSAKQGKVLGDKLPFDLSITDNAYGYKKTDGTFVPFKSQADIDSAVAAAMVGTATADDVLAPKTFTNSTTSGVVGTMTDRSGWNATGTMGSNTTIPKGYHDGTGYVYSPTISLSGDAENSHVLNGKTYYSNSTTKKTGSMTNRGAWTATGTSGGNTYIPEGYHNGSGYVYSPSVPVSIQTKNAGTLTPGASWSSSTTNSVTISKDSGYDGMSQATFNVPMIRDYNILKYSTKDSPSTIYQGDTAVSNSKQLIRVAPYKDGMAYQSSYLYVDPDEWGGGGAKEDFKRYTLWTNSNPTSSFSEQTITLSSSIYNYRQFPPEGYDDYDLIEIEYYYSTEIMDDYHTYHMYLSVDSCSTGDSSSSVSLSTSYLPSFGIYNGSASCARVIKLVSQTQMQITHCYKIASGTKANTLAIPYKITYLKSTYIVDN